ncbi:MAG: 2-succinylbenzoate--CoA ligase [Thermosynechococcaceae cyanobacterium]
MNSSQIAPVEYLSAAHHLQQRQHQQWLLGLDDWASLTQAKVQDLLPFTQAATRPRILLNLQNPTAFLAAFLAACITESPVFLGNPTWSQSDWQQVLTLSQPHIIWSDTDLGQSSLVTPPSAGHRGQIMIPTGGSSGQIRFAMHTWTTLMASVQGTQQYFEVPAIHSCCALPLYHVSGLMQFLRSFTTGGKLVILPFRDLWNGTSANPEIADFLEVRSHLPQTFFLSLVPTQLQRLLQKTECLPWLTQFHTVLLGGAPATPDLLDAARHHQIHLAPTYGMTETAAQIATLKPEDFLKGHCSSGQILPHAQIEIQNTEQQPLPLNQTGRVVVHSPSLCLGYYPDRFTHFGTFVTDDLGYLSEGEANRDLNLHIVGRHSRKILSGGENIFPEEIEAAIHATGFVTDVYVMSLADQEWGEVAIALYTPATPEISALEIKAALQSRLSKFKYPKRWIVVDEIPRNSQGKVSRTELGVMLRSHFNTQDC